MPIQDRDYYREQWRRRHRGRASANTTPPNRPRNAESGGAGNRPLPPGRGSRPSGRWRIVAILLVGCLIGGGIVFGVTRYLGQNPAGRDSSIVDAPPTPNTATAPQVVLRFTPTAPPALLSAATTTLVATITPIPATATPVSAPGLTERESLVAAFAQCDGQYSGDEERFRAQVAETAIRGGQANPRRYTRSGRTVLRRGVPGRISAVVRHRTDTVSAGSRAQADSDRNAQRVHTNTRCAPDTGCVCFLAPPAGEGIYARTYQC